MDEAELLKKVAELRGKKSIREMAAELGVSKSKVGRALDKLKKGDGDQAEERLRAVIREEMEKAKEGNHFLPMVRKVGQGVEVVNPEVVLQQYLLQDGPYGECMLKGMMLLRAAQLMVMDDVNIMKGQAEAHAKLMEPILKLVQETREEQDAAAERARASSLEAAAEAAKETVGQVMPYLDQRLRGLEAAVTKPADIASTANPMQGLMARTMETVWNRMVDTIMPSKTGQKSAPTGWTVERRAGDDGP